MGIYIIFIVFALISFAVQKMLQAKFDNYSKVPIPNGLTGKDIAEKMLRDNGINDVKVISVEGRLTDHYNPETHTVNLSQDVYYSNSVAAAAVAAHECGHAVQHARAYSFLTHAFQISTRCEFCITMDAMGIISRDIDITSISPIDAVWYYIVCVDYVI